MSLLEIISCFIYTARYNIFVPWLFTACISAKYPKYLLSPKSRADVSHGYSLCKDTIPKIGNKYSQNETARPRSLFLHSCICERFIYSHDRSANFGCSKIGGPISGNIYNAHRYMNVEIGNQERGCAFSFLGILKSDLFYSIGNAASFT